MVLLLTLLLLRPAAAAVAAADADAAAVAVAAATAAAAAATAAATAAAADADTAAVALLRVDAASGFRPARARAHHLRARAAVPSHAGSWARDGGVTSGRRRTGRAARTHVAQRGRLQGEVQSSGWFMVTFTSSAGHVAFGGWGSSEGNELLRTAKPWQLPFAVNSRCETGRVLGNGQLNGVRVRLPTTMCLLNGAEIELRGVSKGERRGMPPQKGHIRTSLLYRKHSSYARLPDGPMSLRRSCPWKTREEERLLRLAAGVSARTAEVWTPTGTLRRVRRRGACPQTHG
eukprot:355528-Chlamydomonas_euryale.AAC.15